MCCCVVSDKCQDVIYECPGGRLGKLLLFLTGFVSGVRSVVAMDDCELHEGLHDAGAECDNVRVRALPNTKLRMVTLHCSAQSG